MIHHFYFEKTSELEDIPGEQVVVAQLPAPPAGTEVKRVDVVIRINQK